MHLFSSIVLSALCMVTSTVSAADTNYFINPPTPGAIHQYADNNVYVEGAALDLEWTTDYPTITLYFWQNDNDTAQVLINNQHTDQQLSYKLDLTGTFDLKGGNGKTLTSMIHQKERVLTSLLNSVLLPDLQRHLGYQFLQPLFQHHRS